MMPASLSRRRYSALVGLGHHKATGARASKPRLATPKTVRTYVPSPRVPGAREEVQRVVDPIEHMWRTHQLGDRQHSAAVMFRAAWDCVESQLGNAMDFDRVRSGGAPGRPPAEVYLEAAERMRLARNRLYRDDYQIVVLVCGQGFAVKDAAPHVQEHFRVCGLLLRRALLELADLWDLHTTDHRSDVVRAARIVSQRDFDPRAVPQSATEIQPGRVAHADRRGVKMTGR